MINTAFILVMGAAGFFIEIRGGVTLIMAFLMVFQGKWNRRAGVATVAEWMKLRFGDSREGDCARVVSAAARIGVVAMITCFAVGSGKFAAEFLNIPPLLGFEPAFIGASLMIALAMIYTAAGGLYGVVCTDVFQGAY